MLTKLKSACWSFLNRIFVAVSGKKRKQQILADKGISCHLAACPSCKLDKQNEWMFFFARTSVRLRLKNERMQSKDNQEMSRDNDTLSIDFKLHKEIKILWFSICLYASRWFWRLRRLLSHLLPLICAFGAYFRSRRLILAVKRESA